MEHLAPWRGVDRLLASTRAPADLEAHGLQLLAARRLRARSEPLPAGLADAQRDAVRRTLAVPLVLERIRAACEGPLVLFKGYELALHYPDPVLRPFDDVDILAEQPEAVHRALQDAGFVAAGEDESYYERRHHLKPLLLPDIPLVIEIHRRPEWITWAPPPATGALVAAAVPSRTGISGLSALAPADHALAVAAHSWAGLPLRRVLDFLDTALLAAVAEPGEVEQRARELGIDGLWSLTARVQDALFGEAAPPAAVRRWGRATLEVRDPTVAEVHHRRLLAGFAVLPAHRAVPHALRHLARELERSDGEPWSSKLRRTLIALRHPSMPSSVHDRVVAEQLRRKS